MQITRTEKTDHRTLAWLRILMTPAMTVAHVRALICQFELPEMVFDAGRRACVPILGRELSLAMFDAVGEENARRVLEWRNATSGADILTIADSDYPVRLSQLAFPPLALFLRGRRELLGKATLAVMGTHEPDVDGVADAHNFGVALAKKQVALVCGLMPGIERTMAEASLSVGGEVIAVAATGPDRIYPATSCQVFRDVAERGLIVSANVPGMGIDAHRVRARDELVVGLSDALFVLEAADDARTSAYASTAAHMGRDVMVVPGSIHSPLYKGSHRLLKQGAKLVESVPEILSGWRCSV